MYSPRACEQYEDILPFSIVKITAVVFFLVRPTLARPNVPVVTAMPQPASALAAGHCETRQGGYLWHVPIAIENCHL